jgi:hypothetical protein
VHRERSARRFAFGPEAERTGGELEVQPLERQVRQECCARAQPQLLGHPHQRQPHPGELDQLDAARPRLETGVGIADLARVVEDVHPGFAPARGGRRRSGQRTRPAEQNVDHSQPHREQQQEKGGKADGGPAERFQARSSHFGNRSDRSKSVFILPRIPPQAENPALRIAREQSANR